MATLVVETGTGLDPNANSYIALIDAVAYLDARLYTDAWDEQDDDQKTLALIMATRVIDAAAIFRGYKKIQSQPLQWPRVKARNDEYAGSIAFPFPYYPWIYYDENSIPPILAQATCVEALELLRGDRTVDQGAPGIRSLGLGQGAMTMTFDSSTNTRSTSDEVRKMLARLVKGFRGAGGGMKRVVRVR